MIVMNKFTESAFRVKAAILVVVVQALISLSRRALTQTQHYVISGAAFVGLFFLNLSYPVIVIASGVYGAFFLSAYHKGPQILSPEGAQSPQLSAFSFGRFAITLGAGLCLWLCPLVIVFWGIDVPFLAELGWFFSKLALVDVTVSCFPRNFTLSNTAKSSLHI